MVKYLQHIPKHTQPQTDVTDIHQKQDVSSPIVCLTIIWYKNAGNGHAQAINPAKREIFRGTLIILMFTKVQCISHDTVKVYQGLQTT